MNTASDTATRLEQAWHAHAPELRRFVRRRIRDDSIVDDLVQEAFLRLHQGVWPDNVRAWLFQVVRHLLIDHVRRRHAHVPLPAELPEEPGTEREQPYAALETCLPAMLSRLPATDRESLTLAELDEVPQKRVAQTLGISLSGAKSRVQRARRRLHKVLAACCHLYTDRAGRLLEAIPKDTDSCVFFPAPPSSLLETPTQGDIMKKVTVEWRHLEVGGATCERCGDTGEEVRNAVAALNQECLPRNVWFELRDTPLSATELAQSNSLLIDGRPIEQLLPDTRVGRSDCLSCGTLVGTDAVCRTLEQDDTRYETIPARLIRDAACRAVDCCTASCGCS
ncbi:MAG: sigma-70 family RNA polymerase sigma factor [Pseudomonadota bacterium]